MAGRHAAQRTRSAGGRLRLITVDQVVSGLSNVIVALLSAHLLGQAAFGLFGLVMIIYAAAQGVNRSLVGDPVLVHPEDARDRPGAPISAALIVGAGVGLLTGGVGAVIWAAGLPLGPELLILAVALPGLVLQDLGRYYAFATQRPGQALALDLLWLVLVAVVMVVMVARDAESLSWFVVGWVGSGALASLLVFAQHPAPLRGGAAWLRERWTYSWRFLLSFSAMQGAALAFSVAVAGIAGAAALGAVRGALLMVRPFMLFQAAAVAHGVTEVANDQAPRRTAHLRRTATIAIVIAAANAVGLLLLPDGIGRLVLADTWDATTELLPPACLQILALGFVVPPRSWLTGVRAVHLTVRLDIGTVVLTVAAGTVGAMIDGARGAYWGTAIGTAIGAVAWWTVVLRTGSGSRVGETADVAVKGVT